jgi:hypothetical protein
MSDDRRAVTPEMMAALRTAPPPRDWEEALTFAAGVIDAMAKQAEKVGRQHGLTAYELTFYREGIETAAGGLRAAVAEVLAAKVTPEDRAP